MESYIVWSEIGSGFGELGGTPHQEFQGVPPPGFWSEIGSEFQEGHRTVKEYLLLESALDGDLTCALFTKSSY